MKRHYIGKNELARQLVIDLLDGDPRSFIELSAGRVRVSVDAAVTRLEHAGVLHTWTHPDDHRQRLVALTNRARAIIRAHTGFMDVPMLVSKVTS